MGKDYSNYLEKSQMEEEGTWATENEIFAIADLLETTLFALFAHFYTVIAKNYLHES